MEKQLHKLDLPFTIFEAVQGNALTEDEITSYYDTEYYNNRPSYFTPGAAGCSLSHFFIYKKIVEEKIDVALILEDDMALDKNLPRVLQKLFKEIRYDEIIMLFYQSYFDINLYASSKLPLTEKYNLYQVTDIKGLRSTGGYLIRYETAKKMTENLLPFCGFADDWQSFYNRKIFNGIRLVYPFLLNNTYQATTISPNSKGGNTLKKIMQFVENYKVFPLYQLFKWRRKINIIQTSENYEFTNVKTNHPAI